MDPGVYTLQEPIEAACVQAKCPTIFSDVQLEELEKDAESGPPRWRLPDAEVTRLRCRGQEQHVDMAERQLARDEERNAQRTYEPAALRTGGVEVARAAGKHRAPSRGGGSPLSVAAGELFPFAEVQLKKEGGCRNYAGFGFDSMDRIGYTHKNILTN